MSGAADTPVVTEKLRSFTVTGLVSQRDKGDRSLRSIFTEGFRIGSLVCVRLRDGIVIRSTCRDQGDQEKNPEDLNLVLKIIDIQLSLWVPITVRNNSGLQRISKQNHSSSRTPIRDPLKRARQT